MVVGNVVYEHISKGANLVTVKMDEMKAGGRQGVRLASNREKKLTMTLEEYNKAVQDAEREREQTAASQAAAAPTGTGTSSVDVRSANDDWVLGG